MKDLQFFVFSINYPKGRGQQHGKRGAVAAYSRDEADAVIRSHPLAQGAESISLVPMYHPDLAILGSF